MIHRGAEIIDARTYRKEGIELSGGQKETANG